MLPKCVALPASAEYHGAASSFVPVAEESGAKGYQHNQNATLVVARPFSNMICLFHPCTCGNAIVGRFKYDLLQMQMLVYLKRIPA